MACSRSAAERDAPDWATIPAPHDDGATRHLPGARMASVPLRSSDGETVDVTYSYARRTIKHVRLPAADLVRS